MPANAAPAVAPLHPHAQSAPELSADELRAWQDRIRAAESNDEALLQLAHQAPGVDLKLAALKALTQEDSFKRAMREFRDQDKRLHRAARLRWQEASGRREANAEAQALIAGARALFAEDTVPANRIVELDRAWAALNTAWLEAPLTAEFAALREQLSARVRARGEGEQAIKRWLSATDGAIKQLRASLAGVAQGDDPPAASATLAAGLLELVVGFSNAGDAGDARCVEKTDAANRALALAASVVQRAEFLQSLPTSGVIDEADEKSRIEQWRAIPEAANAQLQEILARRFADWRNASSLERQHEHEARRTHERELNAEHKKQHLSAVQGSVEAAEAAHAAGHVADLTRLMTVIDQALKSGPVNAALTRRIDALRREQLRLRNWQRWSGKQGREQLVAEAQALAAEAGGKIAIKAHAEAIDKLRERWKELDKLGGATNQSLWLAFDGALKTAHAPIEVHLDKLKIARKDNLAARNQIVDGLIQAAAKHFAVVPQAAAKLFPAAQDGAATDAAPDWRAIARTLEDAQVAWRKLGPIEHTVPRKAQQGDNAVTTRYAQATQTLAAPLETAYREAIATREQLIGAAMALAGDPAARDVLDKVRALQSQWQVHAKSLSLPRRDENRLWTAFKTATDAIFTARDAARAAKESEFSAKIRAREEIIERLDALTKADHAAEIKRAMAEAESAWRAAAEVPRPHASKLEARYRSARDAVRKHLSELGTRASQARYVALIAAMALCHDREVAMDTAQELTAQQTADLEARWIAIENLPDAWKAPLAARFQRTPAPATPAGAKPGARTGEGLSDILLYLEVALNIESPGEFAAARQRLKLVALKNAMEGRQSAASAPADIERWMLAAAATPRPDEISRERLARIIAAVSSAANLSHHQRA